MKRILLALMILCMMPCLGAEVRSIWVLPWNMQSKKAIDQVIADAVYAHQNEILLEVRYRSDALYTPNRLNSDFANPEPRSYILKDDGFDPLAYTIAQASARKIKVQAWVIVFNATPVDSKLVQNNYIYRRHPGWITYNERAEQMRSSAQFGYFIDPGIPQVQDYLLDVFSDIVSGYPELAGLHLDYVRYPDSVWGHHPISKRRYATEGKGLSWNDWRTLQVTEFVTKCRDRIKSIRPEIMLSAAVFADIEQARNLYAQDWYSWLQQGLIDRAYPMAYQMNCDIFKDQMRHMSRSCDPDSIVVGIRAWDPQGRNLMNTEGGYYSIDDVAKRIKIIRDYGFAGIALFSYEGLRVGDALRYLGNHSYLEVPELAYIPSLRRKDIIYPISQPGLKPVRGGQALALNQSQVAASAPASAPGQSSPLKQDQIPPLNQSNPAEPVPAFAPKQSQLIEPTQAPVLKETTPVEQILVSEPEPVVLDTKSLEASFSTDRDMYIIHLEIPQEGRWLWELQDENRQRVYHRHRYYTKGDNEDYWDGLLSGDTRIPAGKYKLLLDSGKHSYQADVFLGELRHE